MTERVVLLTPEEVADILRVTPPDVLRLLDDGSLAGISIAGHWRVNPESVKEFLSDGLKRHGVRAIHTALNDPGRWATALREAPDISIAVQRTEYPDGSFGAFLKDALRRTQIEKGSQQTMGTIILYHGTGAGDFEIVGHAWEANDARQILFNARRLLVARKQADAIALLDSAPFAAFPATNHFNDDFYVLHAEVPLHDYESVRLTQEHARSAARELAAAITESTGPYIRFVSVGLSVAIPDEWDVFICHASDDKEHIARPLYHHLTLQGITCWLDEAEIAWGESIVGKIQEGLSCARYVIVVLSQNLLTKKWAKKELQSALALEIAGDRSIVLPLIVGEPQPLLSSLPLLQEKRHLLWNGDLSEIERELRILARKHAAGPVGR